MKYILILVSTIIFSLTSFAQMPPASKPDTELSSSEAKLRIEDWTQKVNALREKLNSATSKKEGIAKELAEAIQNLKDCKKALNDLLGASDADYTEFRQKLGVIEGKVREMKRMSNDALADARADVVKLEADLNALRGNKLSLLPEFYNKIIALARDIKGLYREKKITTYTVGTWAENRDCLWNIAGKIEIYGDALLWPKIWQGNRSIVRNPDIIQPGQVFTLPAKGPMDAEEKRASRKYYRELKESMESAQTGGDVGGGTE